MATLNHKKTCAFPGCHNLPVGGGCCPVHGGKEADRTRTIAGKERDALYSTKRWTDFARRFKKNNHLCAGCLLSGVLTPARVVDHILPMSAAPELDPFSMPMQSLCHKCHSRSKQSLERRGMVWDARVAPGMVLTYADYIAMIKHTGEYENALRYNHIVA